MIVRFVRGWHCLLVLVIGLLFSSDLAAQDVVVRGRVLGPDGAGLAEQTMLLHRVDRSGGATIAEAISGVDGAYVMTAPTTSDTAAIYFVASRYQGELFIGQMFRVTGQDTANEVLQVGVAATSASAMLGEAEPAPSGSGRPATSASWLLFLLPLLGVAAAVLYMIVPRRRVAPDRAILIRIAEIDERLDAAPPGQADSMRSERAHLIEQLRTG